ncbi:MAG: DUF924 domain-containing protein [Alkalimonas sp.]|nr:DUF924 domain-containing protein [Alkalimonas sp.]
MLNTVLTFWFEELNKEQWFVKDPELDQQIRDVFGSLHHMAARCELYPWRQEPRGRLAEIIVLDQFSRNIYRDSAQAFACDPLALGLAQEAINLGLDQELTPTEQSFLYLPFMHSESLAIHDVAMRLYDQEGLEDNLQFEIKHRDIIERFGRYPHRNALLGRTSTEEELAFLQQPGSGF